MLIGGSGNEKTRAIIGQINQYAVKNNVRVYMYDPQIDGGITVDKWGYTQTTSICEENSPIAKMYTGLIDRHLTNLTEAKTTESVVYGNSTEAVIGAAKPSSSFASLL